MRLHKTNVEPSATHAWHAILDDIIQNGDEVSPRGMKTYEIIKNSVAFPMCFPIVTDLRRKLNYKFMAAEALWMIDGDNRLAPLAAVNPNMAQFSDDGETLWGAYGVRIKEQRDHVITSLYDDVSTRQSVLTTWIPNPKRSNDVPCTVSMKFFIRNNCFNIDVDMRSSDSWLGIPYDFFSFACVALNIYNELRAHQKFITLRPGYVIWSATSSHLYEKNYEDAREIIAPPGRETNREFGTFAPVHHHDDDWLRTSLRHCIEKRESPTTPWVIRPEKLLNTNTENADDVPRNR